MYQNTIQLFVVIFLCLNLGASFAKGKDDHHHKDKHHDKKDRCDHSEFKSWDKLKNSSIVDFSEDESSIVIETDCKIKLHKDFNFSTDKDLSIFAKELEIKKDSNLSAGRLLIVTDKEFELKKGSNLCGSIVIIEAKKDEMKGNICPEAILLGSAFDKPSAQAVLEVSLDSERAPVSATFDWSKSFGLFESASIDFGDGSSQVVSEKSFVKVYENAGDFIARLSLQTASGEVLSNAINIKVEQRNPIVDFGVWHVIRRGGTPPEVWLAPNLYPLVEEPEQIKEYRWLFGDGSSLVMPFAESPDGFVVHTFPAMGVYDVEVEAVTVSGASKKASLTIDLNNPSVPVPKYRVSSFKGEAPFTVTFTGEAYDEAGETITYNWYFYDTDEQFFGEQFQEVTHTFNNSGVNYVYLETRDNLRGRRVTYIPIYVGEVPGSNGVAPVAIVESTSRFGEGPLTIDFSGIRSFDPSGNPEGLSYYWNFGDFRSGALNEAFTANAQHTFNKPGAYFVNLVVTNAEGLQHSEFTLVTVDGPEVNDIDFELTPTGNLYEYNFSAYGYFEETDYLQVSARWGFGDGTYLTYEPNVNHQYQASGVYDVELKLRRPDGDYDSYTRRLTVADNQQTSYAQIEKQSEWFNIGQSVQMRANFNQGISSNKTIYRWSMGDGSIIKGQGDAFKTIVHTYFEEGNKNIKLTITDDNGLTSTSYSDIKENRYAPEIDGLIISNIGNPAPVTVAFEPWQTTRDLDGNLSYFIYEFGDGSANFETTSGYVQHRYNQAGTYNVAVAVFDSAGLSSRFERELVIKENQAPILSDFNIHYSNQAAPALVGFEAWPYFSDVDGFDAQVYEYVWGDGSSEIINSGYGQHTYQVGGDYQVSIRAQDNLGKWSEYVTKTLSVRTNLAPIIAYVPVYGQPDQPAPTTVAFAPYEGTTDDEGVNRYTYDFMDGSPLLDTTDGYVEHVFSSAGTFNVVITAYDFYGLSDSFTVPLTIKANQPPTLSDFELYIPQEVAPALSSVEAGPYVQDLDGYIVQYEINWGDGTVIQSPTSYNEHLYSVAGDYSVSVRAQDNKGAWSNVVSKVVPIVDGFEPFVDFAIITNSYVAPVNIIFDGNNLVKDVDNNIIGYSWDIDGQLIQSAGPYLEYNFSSVGLHSVTLTVNDGSGFSVSKNKTFEITPNLPPIANFEIEKPEIDIFEVIGFDGAALSTDPEGRVLAYRWFIDDQLVSSEAIFAQFFETEGTRNVRLEIVDDSENISVIEKPLNVVDSGSLQVLPVITASTQNGVIEETLYLSAEDSNFNGQELASIRWTFNDSEIYDGFTASFTPQVYGEVKVSLKITSVLGLSKEIVQYFNVQQKVIPPSEIESNYGVIISGVEDDRFNSLSEQFIVSLDGGNFNSEQANGYLRLNGEEINFTNEVSQISAPLTLNDGINLIEYSFFDDNGNYVSDEVRVYAGSATLNVNLYDLTNNPVIETDIAVFVSVAKDQSVNKRFLVNGSNFELTGLPLGQELVVSIGGENFVHGERYTVNSLNEVRDIYVTTNLPLTSSSSLSLDQNLTDWTVDNLKFDLGRSRFVIEAGGNALLKRRVEITESLPALNAVFELRFNNDKEYSVYTVKNISTGYLTTVSRSIRDAATSQNQEFNTSLSSSLGVSAGDIVEIEARFYRPEEPTSFIPKFFNAWAQPIGDESSYDLSCKLDTPLIHFDLYEYNERLKEEDYPRKFNKLSAFSISQTIGGYHNNSNKIFVRGKFQDSYVASSEVLPSITAYLYGLKLSSTNDSLYYSVRADSSNPITCISTIGSSFLECNGSTEEILLRNFTQTDFNLRTFNGHTDMNIDVLYSLSLPLDPELPISNCDGEVVKCQGVVSAHKEGGPFKILRHYNSFISRFINNSEQYKNAEKDLRFSKRPDPRDSDQGLDGWVSLRFEAVLRYLLNSNRNVAFNDTSNVNGGKFEGHGGHDFGQEVDLKLTSRGLNMRFTKDEFQELYDLFQNPIMDRTSVFGAGTTFGIFSTFGNEDFQIDEMNKYIGNRCLGVRSASKYILNVTGHETHIHISTRDNGAEEFAGVQRIAFNQTTQDNLKSLENSYTFDAEKNVIYDLNLSDIILDIVKVDYGPASTIDPREERVYKLLFSSDETNLNSNFASGFEVDDSASIFDSSIGRYTRLVLKVNPRLAEDSASFRSKIEFRLHKKPTNACYSATFTLPTPCLNNDGSLQKGRYLSSGAFVSDTATVSPLASLGEKVVVCDNSEVRENASIQGNVTLKGDVVIGSCNVFINGPSDDTNEFLIDGDIEIGDIACSEDLVADIRSAGANSKITGKNIRIGTNFNMINPVIDGDNISIMPSKISGSAGYIVDTKFYSNVSLTNLVNIKNSTFVNANIFSSISTEVLFSPSFYQRLYLEGATVSGASATSRATASGYGFVSGQIIGTGRFSGSGSPVATSQPPTNWIAPALNGSLINSTMSGNGMINGTISNGTSFGLSSIGGYCEGSWSTRGSIISASIGTGKSYGGVLVIHGGTGGQFLSFGSPCDTDPARFDP